MFTDTFFVPPKTWKNSESGLLSPVRYVSYFSPESIAPIALSQSLLHFLLRSNSTSTINKHTFYLGATDGIGKSYALAFAKRGISVVLVSRTESKLQELKKEIEDKNHAGVKVKYVVTDYSNFDEAARNHLYKETKDLDIGILVNNVGMSYRYPVYFHELKPEEIKQLIELNINSTTWMTNMYVEDMAKRGRGTIVNLSSIAGMFTQPLLAQYGACKSYVEKFSRSINAEYEGRGVTCQCHTPSFVATKMSKMRKSFSVPGPDEYVEMSLRFIGQKDQVIQPFWLHATIAWIFTTFADSYITSYYLTTAIKFRKKGLEKDEMIAKGIKRQPTAHKRVDPFLESLMFWRHDLKVKGQ